MPTLDQTPDELRIAERYLWVLDYLPRCADAVRHGHADPQGHLPFGGGRG